VITEPNSTMPEPPDGALVADMVGGTADVIYQRDDATAADDGMSDGCRWYVVGEFDGIPEPWGDLCRSTKGRIVRLFPEVDEHISAPNWQGVGGGRG
jgi:hypothetical protein